MFKNSLTQDYNNLRKLFLLKFELKEQERVSCDIEKQIKMGFLVMTSKRVILMMSVVL